MNYPMKRVFVLVVFLSGLFLNLQAGWIIKETSTFSDRNEKQQRKVYVEGSKIRMDEEDLTTIIDVAREHIVFYNPKKKVFWEGSPDDYDREMIAGMRSKFLESISDYSDSARDVATESFERMAHQLLTDSAGRAERLIIQVSQTKNGEKMLGFPTRIYMVWVNKSATEEVWIAPEVQIFREPDMRKYWQIFNRITRYYEKGFHYQADPKYIYLMTRGYPMRVKEFGYRYDVVTEVTGIKNKKLSGNLFTIPSNAAKVALQNLYL